MEYFIVEHGVMWDAILQVLETKVAEGVEVRFMYDGMGNLFTLPHGYEKAMQEKGIQCKIFAPVRPALSSYQNNRDHRKICVIDGHTAFTGGVNLADEYINQRVRFGHWKDTAVMLKGKAVDSFTMMFLQLWDVTERDAEEYRRFLCPETFHMPEGMDYGGFVMPYADSPLDGENVGESVYLDILGRSRRYVHITTPYLILDDTTLAALKFAASAAWRSLLSCRIYRISYMRTCWRAATTRSFCGLVFRSMNTRRALSMRRCLRATMRRRWSERSTLISEACICILSARPISSAMRL